MYVLLLAQWKLWRIFKSCYVPLWYTLFRKGWHPFMKWQQLLFELKTPPWYLKFKLVRDFRRLQLYRSRKPKHERSFYHYRAPLIWYIHEKDLIYVTQNLIKFSQVYMHLFYSMPTVLKRNLRKYIQCVMTSCYGINSVLKINICID